MRFKIFYLIVLSILLSSFNFSNLYVYSKEYEGNSQWSEEYLKRASKYGFITDKIKSNMSKNITREEFAEISILLLEKLTGKIPSTSGNWC